MAILVAILWSLGGLLLLSAQDPKRRRVFGQPPSKSLFASWMLWIVVWLPGLILALEGAWAGLVLWFGALTSFGWLLVAMPNGWAGRALVALKRRLAAFKPG